MQTTISIMEDGEVEVTLPMILENDAPVTLEEEGEILSNLAIELQKLRETTDILSHKLNTLQELLDQERFELSTYELKLRPHGRQVKIRELLAAIGVQEEGLLMGTFLTALNKWLVRDNHVDLNDLQILMTPLLSAAFYKPPGLKKMPYPLLLLALDKMFL